MKKIISLCLALMILATSLVVSVSATATASTVEPAEGNIGMNPGKFKITFSEAVDNTVLDTITFKCGDADVKGGIYTEVDANNSAIVYVKYGVLEENKEYTLKIGDETYAYTATKFIFNEDFSDDDYVIGSELPESNVLFYSRSGGTAPFSMRHYIDETMDGDKFLRLDTTEKNEVNGWIVVKPASPVENSKFRVNMKVRGTKSGNAANNKMYRRLLYTQYDGNTNIAIAELTNGVIYVPDTAKSSKADYSGAPYFAIANTDSNGFYDLEVVYSRDAEGKYTQTMTNKLFNETMTVKTKDAYSCITEFWPMQSFFDHAGEQYFDLSEFSIEILWDTNVMHTVMGEETIDVIFDGEINAATLTTATMADAEGNPVDISYVADSYSNSTRKATFAFNEVLEPGATYTLSFATVKDAENDYLGVESSAIEVAVSAAPYTVGALTVENQGSQALEYNSEEEYYEIGESSQATISTTVAAAVGTKVNLGLAIYDSEGRLYKFVFDPQTISASGSTTLTATTPTEIDLSEGYSVVPVIWSNDGVSGPKFMSAPPSLK